LLLHGKNNLHLSGAIIEKTGELTYHLTDSAVTTCEIKPGSAPDWSIHSSEANITKEGYAQLQHASLRIKDFPVLYSPYLILPAKTERQTGLLFPEFSNSKREGFGLLLPLFVNISPSTDATLYFGDLSRRGAQAGAEFRYVADDRSRGTFTASYLHDATEDTVLDDFNDDGYLRSRTQRYWLRGKADHYFTDNLVGRLDLDLVSDRDFLQEFRDSMLGFDPNNQEYLATYRRGFQDKTILLRENTLQLSRNWSAMGLYGELRGVDDTRNTFVSPTPLWTMPRLLAAGLTPVADLPLDFSWQSEYVYYWRDRGLGGHRLDLAPRLTAPLPLGPYFEATLSGGVRETLYQIEVNDDATWSTARGQNRTLYDLTANLATTLQRDFRLSAGQDDSTRALRHTTRPYLTYNFLPSIDQTNLPEFDQIDRLAARNGLTYGLANFLKYRTTEEGAVTSRDYAYFDINQSYDFRADRHPLSDILAEIRTQPVPGLMLGYETAINVYGDGTTYYDFKAAYTNSRGDRLSADYYYRKDLGAHELKSALKVKLTDLLSAKYDITHSFVDNVGVISNSFHLIYHPACWTMEAAITKTSDDLRAMVVFNLTGIGKLLEIGRNF
ncbi:MAG: hypothetical protein A2521_03455, partial [Deltaproteobacteria bacterium RIFOXYD12_FULL_57_12]